MSKYFPYKLNPDLRLQINYTLLPYTGTEDKKTRISEESVIWFYPVFKPPE